MTLIIVALVLAVTALMWWATKPLSTNHAENDEAASLGGSTHERKDR